MKPQYTLPLLVIAIASAGAYVSTTYYVIESSPPIAMEAPAPPITFSPAYVAFQGDRDAVAMHDMTLHAFRSLDAPDVNPQSFGTSPSWTPGWELRWLCFNSDGEQRTVYHATAKRQPQVRFTITAAGADAPNDWQLVE